MKKFCITTMAVIAASATATTALAHDNHVSIEQTGDQICITSNGLPNHATGTFPNRGNPHSISEQRLRHCVSANPVRGSRKTDITRGPVGIGLNGILFRPETADYYDPSSPRGFSRDRSSGWNLEGMGAAELLGMDQHNAHVDNRGIYHYHGKPEGLVASVSSTHIGYAADGHEIHYAGSAAQSGWTLKSGTRQGGPGGRHDGTYVEDWEFTGAGNLDECNGGTLDGRYVYFATDTFPFYPRCFWGDVSSDFR
ncbi:MAG: YHYH protein [Oricola sp.]|nr:MAG: YHYH protein [Oricola sp.]